MYDKQRLHDNVLYTGTVVEESLADPKPLNSLKRVKYSIVKMKNPEDDWHLYTVRATEKEIGEISRSLRSRKWYAHFWNARNVIVAFKGKLFRFNYDDKRASDPAVEYWLSTGIPRRQLDFPIA